VAWAVPTKTPAPTPSVKAPAAPVVPISSADGKKLLSEFDKAQASEVKALKRRQSQEIKELKYSQDARRREWERKEKEERHRFFAQHKKGAERRAYIKDFIERRNAFFQILSDEMTQRKQSQDARLKSIQAEQGEKKRDFQNCLDRGERPPQRLWP
jgi:hypothetical protein